MKTDFYYSAKQNKSVFILLIGFLYSVLLAYSYKQFNFLIKIRLIRVIRVLN